jgi:hypothetical protein
MAVENDRKSSNMLQGLENQRNQQLDDFASRAATVDAQSKRSALSMYTV